MSIIDLLKNFDACEPTLTAWRKIAWAAYDHDPIARAEVDDASRQHGSVEDTLRRDTVRDLILCGEAFIWLEERLLLRPERVETVASPFAQDCPVYRVAVDGKPPMTLGQKQCLHLANTTHPYDVRGTPHFDRRLRRMKPIEDRFAQVLADCLTRFDFYLRAKASRA